MLIALIFSVGTILFMWFMIIFMLIKKGNQSIVFILVFLCCSSVNIYKIKEVVTGRDLSDQANAE